MVIFLYILWNHSSFCCDAKCPNAPSITIPPLTPLLITVLNCKLDSFFLPLDDRGCKIATTPKEWDVNSIVFNIIGKVLILFIIQLNNNSISPTKSTQFEGFTLIKMLIKNKNSQHPISYFYVSQGNDLNSLFCFFLSFLLENLSY